MKISFSTLACPDFSWTDIYTMAKDLGFGGIEIRGLGEDIFAVNARPFTDERLPKTLEKLQSLGLEIPCLAAGCALKYKEDFDKNISEIVQYIVLAKKLGTPYIRVLGDRYPQPEGEVDDAFVVDALKLLGVIAQGFNVCLLVETNGVYSDTKRLRELLDKVNMPSVAALWDMHHPYRYAGEAPRADGAEPGRATSSMSTSRTRVMVDGQVPVPHDGRGRPAHPRMMLDALRWPSATRATSPWSGSSAGPRSSADAGIVFPQFANYMHELLRHRCSMQDGELQDNRTHTGKYVWPKETLIDADLPRGAGPHGGGVPRPDMLSATPTLDYTRTYSEFRDDVDTLRPGPHRHGGEDRATTWPSGPPTCPSGTSPSGPPPKSARCW